MEYYALKIKKKVLTTILTTYSIKENLIKLVLSLGDIFGRGNKRVI